MTDKLLDKIPGFTAEEHASALDVVKQQGPSFTLKGKTVLVTGASDGIGLETLRAFAATGARVFSAVRNVDKMRPVLDKIAKEFPANGGLEIVEMDLTSFASINKGADDFLKRSNELHIFVANAGVMVAETLEKTKDGFEQCFGMNHLGHFLLFKRLADTLVKSSTPQFNTRVVFVSSGAHHWGTVDLEDPNFQKGRPFDGKVAYGQSKSANILMTNEIERRYGSKGVHGLSLNPGLVHTAGCDRVTNDQWIKLGLFNAEGTLQGPIRKKTVPQGAATSLFAAVDASLEGQGGKYLDTMKVQGPASETNRSGYSAHVVDEEVARKLWEFSEKTTQQQQQQ